VQEIDRKLYFEKYNARTHLLGRLFTSVALVLFLAAPFLMGWTMGTFPDLKAFARAFLGVGLVHLISCIAEFIIYVPILGGGGSYLAFVTGNLINMKIPCAMNAKDIVGVRSGTPENEIISTLSIATSSLVTILVLALGVLFMIPLQPVLQSPTLRPAFDNVVPALFGAMAYKYYRKEKKVAAITLALMTVLFLLVPSLMGSVSLMIIPSGAIAIGMAYLFFRKSGRDVSSR